MIAVELTVESTPNTAITASFFGFEARAMVFGTPKTFLASWQAMRLS
jgi:hypothetical protein